MDSESLSKIKDVITGVITVYGIKFLAALAILFIGRWVAGGVQSVMNRLLLKRNVDPIIASFVTNLAYILLLIFVVIAALSQIGVQTASLVALLGAAGLAIGLALQGSLANFAAGFLLVFFRPFRKGDYIEAAGTGGVVEEIQVFTTVLKTPDNKKVIVPNAKLTADNIINYSAHETRRLDLNFGVSYSDSLDKVRQILQRVILEDGRILKDPAPVILVSQLGDSSVNFIARIWVKTSDYWGVTFDTIEKVKKTFDQEGVTIPFPQRDVHLIQKPT